MKTVIVTTTTATTSEDNSDTNQKTIEVLKNLRAFVIKTTYEEAFDRYQKGYKAATDDVVARITDMIKELEES